MVCKWFLNGLEIVGASFVNTVMYSRAYAEAIIYLPPRALCLTCLSLRGIEFTRHEAEGNGR